LTRQSKRLFSNDHFFGDHSRCNKFHCLKVGTVGISACYKNYSTQAKVRLSQIFGGVTEKCESFILNATSNRAEMFMHQIAKFNRAKATSMEKGMALT
jgi:hypothetical protein